MNDFHSLEFVNRVSEIQLQVVLVMYTSVNTRILCRRRCVALWSCRAAVTRLPLRNDTKQQPEGPNSTQTVVKR